MDLDDAISRIYGGNGLLFLGSGFSKGAANRRGADFKVASELATHLGTAASAPDGFQLDDAASTYRTVFGAPRLIQELTEEFTATAVEDFQITIAAAPWRRTYSTNYDNVFEFAAKKAGKVVTPVTPEIDPFRVPSANPVCVHLNGFIEGLTEEGLDTSFKLTDVSYMTSSVAASPWAISLQEDARLADCVFIVGYSMYDLDIRRLLFDSPALQAKCFFIVGEHPKALLLQRIAPFGQATGLTTKLFGVRMGEMKSTAVAENRSTLHLRALREVRAVDLSSDTFKGQALLDLFELGASELAYINGSISGKYRYFLERDEVGEIISTFESGAPVIAATAGVGNGKSLLLKGFAIRALERGYRVFFSENLTSDAALDFESVARLDSKTLIIIDNYHVWMRELHAHRLLNNPKAKLLVATRDTTHDLLIGKLESEVGLSSVPEFRLDKLSESEIKWFVATLNEYGLWGKESGAINEDKVRVIKDAYQSEIRGIVLGLLESTDLGIRVRGIINDPTLSRQNADIIASVFLLSSLRTVPPKLETLGHIWSIEAISSSTFRSHPSVRLLIDFGSWTIKTRSSVIAEFILRQAFSGDIVHVLVRMMRAFSTGSRATREYRSLFEEMMKFSSVQRVLPDKGRREATFRFYEEVKTFPQAQNHPLFWFQFALACMFEGEIRRAGVYFQSAYSIAAKTNFNPYQIDNGYARFLLMEASREDMAIEEAMTNFRSARAIINRQIQQERAHYPYRSASLYQEFLDRHAARLRPVDLNEIKLAAAHVVDNLTTRFSKHERRKRSFRECELAMTYISERVDQLTGKSDKTGSLSKPVIGGEL
jgi:hypothetical protein